jgi:photosystem II stability/assembly factor-like uncharacterized protein
MKNIKFIAIFSALLLFTACSFGGSKSAPVGPSNGGVFVSDSGGSTWRHMPHIPTITGRPGSINNVEINKMIADPSDSGAIYLATLNDGLYYTYNVARGWNKVTSLAGNVKINDLAVDANNKCTIFAAIDNRLYKSVDCKRSFSETYYDSNSEVSVLSVAVDHYNPDIVYLGTSRGDVLRSLDGGESWRAIQRLNSKVLKILVNPRDSRSVFVATDKNGVFRFDATGGATVRELEEYRNKFDNVNWIDYRDELEEFKLGGNFRSLVYSRSDDSLILAAGESILRSPDDGSSWTRLDLLTPEDDSSINALTVNTQDGKDIFYVTDTSFYRTRDGGSTWSVRSLPTARPASAILVDFNNPDIIYIGFENIDNN